MNIELKPIAESKVRQMGGDVCGVLVRKDEKLAAVDEHGRVTWLSDETASPEPIIPSVRFTIEPHGSGYAIYRGRDADHHGENLGHLTECMPYLPRMLERAMNAQERPEFSVDRAFLVELLDDRNKRIDALEKQIAEAARAQSGQGVEPVAWMRWRSHRIAADDVIEGLEICEPGEVGDDGGPAFPVYTHPQLTQGAKPVAIVDGSHVLQWMPPYERPAPGTKLYTAPQPAQQGVPEGWRVARANQTARAIGTEAEGFLIQSPRVSGVSANTAVWEDSENPAERLLYLMLTGVKRSQPPQECEGNE